MVDFNVPQTLPIPLMSKNSCDSLELPFMSHLLKYMWNILFGLFIPNSSINVSMWHYNIFGGFVCKDQDIICYVIHGGCLLHPIDLKLCILMK